MSFQFEFGVIGLLRETGIVARVVLVMLAVFSIWSWGIIISKSYVFARVGRQSRRFWSIFESGRGLEEIRSAVAGLRLSPLAPVFESGVAAMKAPVDRPSAGEVATVSARPLATVERSMRRAAASQLTRLEKHLTFLATTASVAPFVGLFGTVWGILTAFMGLAEAERATIQAVAPGIAEALITTAFGLLAAIPAVMAYNQFLYRIRLLGGDLDDLQAEMMAIAESGRV